MGDVEGGRRGESTSPGLGFEDSGAFTPKFGTPERGDLAARVSGREAAEDDGLRFQRAGTSAAQWPLIKLAPVKASFYGFLACFPDASILSYQPS